MPHRKLVQIGKTAEVPELPTVSEYFRALADRQGEDIARLKREAAARAKVRPKVPTKKQAKKTVLSEGWRLHPTPDQLAAAPSSGREKKASVPKYRSATQSAKRVSSRKGTTTAGSRRKSPST